MTRRTPSRPQGARLMGAAATVLCLAIGGAALASPAVESPGTQAAAANLAERDHPTFDHLYLRPGVELGRYDRFVLAPVQVHIERDRRDELMLDDRTIEQARRSFTKYLTRSLGEGRLAQAPGPGTAVIEVTVTEYKANSPVNPRRFPGGMVHRSYGVGEAAFQAVIRDGASGEVVAIVADADVGLPLNINPYVQTEFGDADRFAQRWSRRLADLFQGGAAS